MHFSSAGGLSPVAAIFKVQFFIARPLLKCRYTCQQVGKKSFAGYTPLYALLQVAYALAIGFCFGAMVVKSRLLWPLIIVHGLGNFAAFLNDGQVGMHLYVVTIFYVVSGLPPA